jgi:hypothetical protein
MGAPKKVSDGLTLPHRSKIAKQINWGQIPIILNTSDLNLN